VAHDEPHRNPQIRRTHPWFRSWSPTKFIEKPTETKTPTRQEVAPNFVLPTSELEFPYMGGASIFFFFGLFRAPLQSRRVSLAGFLFRNRPQRIFVCPEIVVGTQGPPNGPDVLAPYPRRNPSSAAAIDRPPKTLADDDKPPGKNQHWTDPQGPPTTAQSSIFTSRPLAPLQPAEIALKKRPRKASEPSEQAPPPPAPCPSAETEGHAPGHPPDQAV